MGRPNYNQSIHHFSHPHPLELSNLQQQQPNTSNLPPCAACKLEPSGSIYICKTCNFILHISCSQKPQLITHPSDPNHPLTLLPFPAYPDGTFTCDACGLQDNGFCYHCRACTLDLHINCASMPMSLNHQAHPHTLHLTIRSPCNEIICHICRSTGRNWFYWCHACNFTVHLSCASNPHAQAAANINMGAYAAPQPVLINNQPINAGVASLATRSMINSLRLQGSRNAVMLTSPDIYYVRETPRAGLTSSNPQSIINSLRLQGSRNAVNLTSNGRRRFL